MATSKKHIRTCSLCKNQHMYCNCEEYKHLEPWHMAYCSENCKDIDGILSDWGAKLMSSEEAYKQLQGKDISRIEFWPESFRNAYETILEETKHTNFKYRNVSGPSAKEEPKAENTATEESETPKVNPLEVIKAKEATEGKKPVVKKTVKTTSKIIAAAKSQKD